MGRGHFGPGGRKCNMSASLARLMRSACLRNEIFGGAHRPVSGWRRGINGLGSCNVAELFVSVDEERGPNRRICLGRAFSSFSRNCFTARAADITTSAGVGNSMSSRLPALVRVSFIVIASLLDNVRHKESAGDDESCCSSPGRHHK